MPDSTIGEAGLAACVPFKLVKRKHASRLSRHGAKVSFSIVNTLYPVILFLAFINQQSKLFKPYNTIANCN